MECTEWRNQSQVTEFLLLAFSDFMEHRLIFIMSFLTAYLVSLAANIFIISAVNLDPQLDSPMYFFLGHLSFVDLSLTSVSVPKLLHNLLTMNTTISFLGCITQMHVFMLLLTTECFLLAMMAYDRYVAICNPLLYRIVMSAKLCMLLLVACWVLSFLHTLLQIGMTSSLCFCGPNTINTFFCDVPPILELSCSDTSLTHLVLLVEPSFLAALLFLFMLVTYVWIIRAILKLSTQNRQKTFMTCSSHLTVIITFYGTCAFMYLFPTSASSQGRNSVVSIIYALVTPMLNPFIYTLRNKDMKRSFKKALARNPFQIKQCDFCKL